MQEAQWYFRGLKNQKKKETLKVSFNCALKRIEAKVNCTSRPLSFFSLK